MCAAAARKNPRARFRVSPVSFAKSERVREYIRCCTTTGCCYAGLLIARLILEEPSAANTSSSSSCAILVYRRALSPSCCSIIPYHTYTHSVYIYTVFSIFSIIIVKTRFWQDRSAHNVYIYICTILFSSLQYIYIYILTRDDARLCAVCRAAAHSAARFRAD